MKTLTYLAAAACFVVVGCAAAPSADKGLQAYSPDEPAPVAAAPTQPAAPTITAQRAAPAASAAPAARPTLTAATAAAGKTILESSCAACHAPTLATESRHTQAEWDDIIDSMISRGASLTDDEHKTLLAYLSAAYGS